jgi:hypothetical protein
MTMAVAVAVFAFALVRLYLSGTGSSRSSGRSSPSSWGRSCIGHSRRLHEVDQQMISITGTIAETSWLQ